MVILEVENRDDTKLKIKKHLSETLSTIKYVIFFARIAGLMLLSFDQTGYRLDTTQRKVQKFYTTTYLSGYFAVCFVAFNSTDSIKNASLYIVIKYIFNVCCCGNSFLQVAMGYFFNSPISSWFNKLATWDADFELFGLRVSSRPLQNIFSGLIFVDTCIFATRITLYVAAVRRHWSICLCVAAFYVLKSTSKYLLVFTIIHLHLRFQKLNEAIGAINVDSPWDAINIVQFSKSLRKDSPLKLNQLCRFHFRLGQLSKEVNQIASLYFFYAFAVSSGSLLFFSYYLYHNIRPMYIQKAEFSAADVTVILYGVVSLIGEMADCFVITKSCTLLCNAANETPRHLHELRNRIQGREWDEQIAASSLQFLHQKIVFTAKGYFDISFSVLGSISSTVLTYLVLFIQQDQELVTQ